MTLIDTAVAVSIGRPTLTDVENGKREPGRSLLLRLAKFYGVSVDQLYDGSASGDVPEDSKRVKNADELALLTFWRKLDEPAQRLFLLALARGPDETG